MTFYVVIKYAHIFTAMVSIVLFLYRANIQIKGMAVPRVLKFLPHVNDTLLFALGIVMLYLAQLNVMQLPWLQLKFVLIVVYILFGMFSLKWATSYQQQKYGVMMAALTYGAIVLLAIKKQTTF